MTNKLIEEYQDAINNVKIQQENLNESRVISLGISVFKRYMSQAAKACKKFRFGDKTNCMRQHEIKAIRAEIGSLQSNLNKCDQEKKPSVCRAKVDKKLIRLEDKLRKLNLNIATFRLKNLTKK